MTSITVTTKFKETADSLNIMLMISHVWLKDLFIELLSAAGIKVWIADKIDDLLSKLDFETDVLIIDVADYQGHYQVLFEQLRQKSPSLSIVALLSTATEGYRDRILLAGANGVVVKEEAHRELIPVLVQVLNGCQIKKNSSDLLNNLKNKLNTLSQKEVKELVEKKQKESALDHKLSRRTFLKASAFTAAATGAIAANPWGQAMTALAGDNGSTNGPVEAGEKIYYGSCRGNCFSGCRLQIKVRDGKVVQTEMAEFPDPRYNRICMKGLSHVQRIYDPNRLKYPMKRVGERGAGQWERITWDEAIQTIATKWKELQGKYGKSSVAFETLSGNFANGTFTAPERLRSLLGATSISASVDMALFYGSSNAFGVGEFISNNEMADLLSAKTIVIWGANPVEAQVQNMHFILEAKDAGAKVIVIDPIYTATAAKADIHVPIRPGTDAALAMAMANVIIKENLIDKSFLKKSSVASFLVKASDGKYLRQSDLTGTPAADPNTDPIMVWDSQKNTHGTVAEVADPALHGSYVVNGIQVTTAYDLLLERIAEYTPEYASELCQVPVDTIVQIAKLYAQNTPSSIYHGYGTDHYVNGHYAIFAACTLAILTGNVGKPGATAGLASGGGFFFNTMALQNPPGSTPGPAVTVLKLPDIVKEQKYGDMPLTLKSIYVYSGNPLGNMGERAALLEAFKQMELLVVADMTMTDTAMFADIILPVAHWFEVDDMHGTVSQIPYLILQEKAIEPLYECKSDWEIVSLLGKAMGHGEHFKMNAEELMKFSLDTDFARAIGITYERLKKEKVLRNLSQPENYIHGAGGVFPTPTGRAQFYLEAPVPLADFGQKVDIEKERLPHWEPPHEAWSENPLAKKYPLVYGQSHTKWRVHTQWARVPWLKELDPEPIVNMYPVDAEKRGIKKGDMVKVFNDRGYVVLKAIINNGVRPGMIVVPKGWESDQYVSGHYQDLTSRVTNNACINNSFFDALVEVEKA